MDDTVPESPRSNSLGLWSIVLLAMIVAAVYFLFWERRSPEATTQPGTGTTTAVPRSGAPRTPAGAHQTSHVGTAGLPGDGPTGSITTASFDRDTRSGVVLLDFWAVWCAPCRTQGPIVDAVAQKFAGRARVSKVDVDADPQLADRFQVESIPTIVIVKDGREVGRFVGVTREGDLTRALNAAL